MKLVVILAAAIAAFGQPKPSHDNYYSPNRDSQVGQRIVTQLHAKSAADPRVDQIGKRLAAKSPQFQYQFFVFEGGQPSPDTAPAAAFPADWRRLELDEAIAVAGGFIFVPRRLLSRDDAQLTAILAHAIGHVALRHPTVGMTRGELAQVEVQVASRSMPDEATPAREGPSHWDGSRSTASAKRLLTHMPSSSFATPPWTPRLCSRICERCPAPEGQDYAVYPPPAERVEGRAESDCQSAVVAFLW